MRESSSLEFKSKLSRTFLKTASAFANYGTGKIIFGADDNGEPLGLDDPVATCLSIENSINDGVSPTPHYELEVDDVKRLVTLTVHEGKSKPYLVGGKAYRRADSSTVAVNRLEYNRLTLDGMNTSFDALECQSRDFSFNRLEYELAEKTGLQKLDRSALVSLELMDFSGAYNNAAALLADVNDFAGVDVARFGDSINVILSRSTFEHVSVLIQMDSALKVFDEHYVYEEIVDYRRITKARIPRDAFREAVANALVHRCWDVRGNIKIGMFADRIEITSPGGLPDGLTEEEYLNGGPSVSRNPILANVFYRLGYIERFGTGIPRIVSEYAEMAVSPKFIVREASITVVLPVEEAVSVDSDERKVLAVLPKGVLLSRKEVEEAAGMSKDKTIKVLNALMGKGLVTKQGAGRGTKYLRG